MYTLVGFLILLSSVSSQFIRESDIEFTSVGIKFQPQNPSEFLSTLFVGSLLTCSQSCNLNRQCRTFNYDSLTLQCKLYKSDYTTGTIASASLSSRVGALAYRPSYYFNYNQTCGLCEQYRYLICSNGTCQCPLGTFWNGQICLNLLYNGSQCRMDSWCRQDLNLTCIQRPICGTSSKVSKTFLTYSSCFVERTW
ncbi:unnamed protein product [Didymodactylos carnosus]|uniref:Apple domain-containing protein n=1 Tax=Didymodactylos carnosus TaxID=1234261 RepID=A0A8S2KAX0_9BILA|nr:unnamed protein product [Didymodactylos carnosus]CAF3842722.1 unnamed protein product [Didymodactylos carnosus]